MARRRESRRSKFHQRKGSPFTLYLRPGQAERLSSLSRKRHVAKSELVRVAIDRFLASLEKDNSTDPIGLSS
ncbi:MAG: ribbon-helix-helix domain-containing protein [Acidobacteria bacterium]|nr:ribbon-helix-helix domain-containing protein [Acidobacteriota bacterium]